jgi:hypothetical protein
MLGEVSEVLLEATQKRGRRVEGMRRVALVLAATALSLLLASGVAMARATTETYSIRDPESFTIDNPCPGYEEPILVEGVFHHVVQVTQVEGDFYRSVIHTNSNNVTGTGLETGDEYRFINTGLNAGGSFNTEGGPNGVANTLTYEVSYIIVSEGASPNFMLHEKITLVLDEDSNPNIYHEQLRVSCTPGAEPSQTGP